MKRPDYYYENNVLFRDENNLLIQTRFGTPEGDLSAVFAEIHSHNNSMRWNVGVMDEVGGKKFYIRSVATVRALAYFFYQKRYCEPMLEALVKIHLQELMEKHNIKQLSPFDIAYDFDVEVERNDF